MANNYSEFNKLFKGFISGQTGNNPPISINIENFNAESLGAFNEHQDAFWDGLLQYLQREATVGRLNHDFAIRESDFNKDEENHKQTIIEYITNNIDVISSFLDDLYNKKDFSHWNESFQKLVSYYQDNFGDNAYYKEIDSTAATVGDIINANAGNSFTATKPWVIPWFNKNTPNTFTEFADDAMYHYLRQEIAPLRTPVIHNIAVIYPKYMKTKMINPDTEEIIIEGPYEFTVDDLEITEKSADNFKRSVEAYTDGQIKINIDVKEYYTDENEPIIVDKNFDNGLYAISYSHLSEEIQKELYGNYDGVFIVGTSQIDGYMGTTLSNYTSELPGPGLGASNFVIQRTSDNFEMKNNYDLNIGFDYIVMGLSACFLHEWLHQLEAWFIEYGYKSQYDLSLEEFNETDETFVTDHCYQQEEEYCIWPQNVLNPEDNPYFFPDNQEAQYEQNFYRAWLRGEVVRASDGRVESFIPILYQLTPTQRYKMKGVTYSDVRGNDKIERVLSSNSHMQFTHNLFKKYIRLLMPEYERTVEVEDLNRNFWVIGQVLTGICSYLFDEDSPIKNLLEGMADEVAQLWENLLYLWIGFVLISQEFYKEEPIVIVVPVPLDKLNPYIKFDDFFPRKSELTISSVQSGLNQIELLTVCWEYLSYLKDLYTDRSLLVIPEIRYGNYAFNYYCGAIYPGVISYNRNIANMRSLSQHQATDENLNNKFVLEYIPFTFKAGENSFYRFRVSPNLGTNGKTVIANHEFTNNLWGFYEKGGNYYFVNDYTTGAAGLSYTAAMRVTFKNCQYNYDINGELDSLSIDCDINDVAKYIYGASNNLILNATFHIGHCYIGTGAGIEVDKGLVCDTTESGVFIDVSSTAPSPDYLEIKKGWYRGEMPSWEKKN